MNATVESTSGRAISLFGESIRENLALKQRDQLPRSRGSSYKRSLAVSWKYALDRFEVGCDVAAANVELERSDAHHGVI